MCILGMLDNNPVSIKYTINERTIMDLVFKFFEEVKNIDERTELPVKYLTLFSTLIRCEDQVIKENQLLVLKHFFLNDQNTMNFKFKVDYKEVMEDEDQPGDLLAKVKSREVKIAFGR